MGRLHVQTALRASFGIMFHKIMAIDDSLMRGLSLDRPLEKLSFTTCCLHGQTRVVDASGIRRYRGCGGLSG